MARAFKRAKETKFRNSSAHLSGEHRLQHIYLSLLALFGVVSGQMPFSGSTVSRFALVFLSER
jgi:hypothetical protein